MGHSAGHPTVVFPCCTNHNSRGAPSFPRSSWKGWDNGCPSRHTEFARKREPGGSSGLQAAEEAPKEEKGLQSGASHEIAWPTTIFGVTRERWAQIGITIQFLIVVRSLGEIFRLRHFHSAEFSAAFAMPYIIGALIAACLCWIAVTLYFFRRYTQSAWIALATVFILLVHKIVEIGW
jgi:hypothetical protein